MGERQVDQGALFYKFSLDRHVPAEHMLRAIDRFVDLEGVRAHLAPSYSFTGRPSVDPGLTIRMLLLGYCFGIRSERRLCDGVHLNLAGGNPPSVGFNPLEQTPFGRNRLNGVCSRFKSEEPDSALASVSCKRIRL